MSDIEYTWMRLDKEGELDKEEIQVFWQSLEVRAETEELGKSTLGTLVTSEKGLAKKGCQREHENMSGCVASKFQSMAGILKQLDFSSRKALEESVAADCQAQLGVCKAVNASEVHCKDMAPPEMEDDDKKMDKKKKK